MSKKFNTTIYKEDGTRVVLDDIELISHSTEPDFFYSNNNDSTDKKSVYYKLKPGEYIIVTKE